MLLVGVAVGKYGARVPGTTERVVQVERETPNVVAAVRELARLEATSFHMERVVDLRDRQQVLFGAVEAEDAILLVASADVTAGVDLARLRDRDVVVDAERKSVRIVLPPPEILSARIDNDRTFVYSRETDVLARRSESLETRARQRAEASMRSAAISAGLLERAKESARRTIDSLVRALGFRTVEIHFADEELPSLPSIGPAPSRPVVAPER